MSKTPDRRPREGPAKSEGQQGLLSGGPWPEQVHRAPGPSTSCPKAEGPFLGVHGAFEWRRAGSSDAGNIAAPLWITLTVIAHPQLLRAIPSSHRGLTQQTLSGSLSGWSPNPTPSPNNVPVTSNASASSLYCGLCVCNILFSHFTFGF